VYIYIYLFIYLFACAGSLVFIKPQHPNYFCRLAVYKCLLNPAPILLIGMNVVCNLSTIRRMRESVCAPAGGFALLQSHIFLKKNPVNHEIFPSVNSVFHYIVNITTEGYGKHVLYTLLMTIQNAFP